MATDRNVGKSDRTVGNGRAPSRVLVNRLMRNSLKKLGLQRPPRKGDKGATQKRRAHHTRNAPSAQSVILRLLFWGIETRRNASVGIWVQR